MTPPEIRAVSPKPAILGECKHCRLPIYATDEQERIMDWPWDGRDLYHFGCAWRVQVRYHQEQLQAAVSKLRLLGCRIDLSMTTPIS